MERNDPSHHAADPGDSVPARSGPVDWAGLAWPALVGLGIRLVGSVPDAGLTGLLRRAETDPAVTHVLLSSEQEGMGLAAGAWLGNVRSVICMQSSGIGNCLNQLTLVSACRFPLLMLVTMRGEWGEFNPWQLAMGARGEEALRLAGCRIFRPRQPEDIAGHIAGAGRLAFASDSAAVVVIGQELLGAKSFAAEPDGGKS